MRDQEVAYWDVIYSTEELSRLRPLGEEDDPFWDMIDSVIARQKCGYVFHSNGELDYYCYGAHGARYLQVADDIIYLDPGYHAQGDSIYLRGYSGLVFRKSMDSLWIHCPYDNDTLCLVYANDQERIPIPPREFQMGVVTEDDDPSHYSLRCVVPPDRLFIQVGKLHFAPLFKANTPKQLLRLQAAADSVSTVWHREIEKNVSEYHYGRSSVRVDGSAVVDFHCHDKNIEILRPTLKVGDSLIDCCPEEIMGKPGRLNPSGVFYLTLCGTNDLIVIAHDEDTIQWFSYSSRDTTRR